MKKLGLELDNLAVESCETDGAPRPQGTVRAAEASAPDPCLPDTYLTCARRQTLYESCVANCECTNGLRACIGPASLDC